MMSEFIASFSTHGAVRAAAISWARWRNDGAHVLAHCRHRQRRQ